MSDGTMAVEPTSAFDQLLATASGVVHMVIRPMLSRVPIALCASRNQNLTGNGLVTNSPPPVAWPTCVYCITYKLAEDTFMARMSEIMSLRISPPPRRA